MKDNLVHIRKGVMSGRNWHDQEAPRGRHPMAKWDVPVVLAEESYGDVTAELIGSVSWGPRTEFRTALVVRLVRAYMAAHGYGETAALRMWDVSNAIACLKALQKTFGRDHTQYLVACARAEMEVSDLRDAHFPGIIPGSDEPYPVRLRTHPRENETAFHQAGRVLARVYANEQPNNRVLFKAELVQLEPRPDGEVESLLVGLGDLSDAVRCLTWAQSWHASESSRWRQPKQ